MRVVNEESDREFKTFTVPKDVKKDDVFQHQGVIYTVTRVRKIETKDKRKSVSTVFVKSGAITEHLVNNWRGLTKDFR